MNDLTLDRSTNFPGQYTASVNLDGQFFCATSYGGWEDVINKLLTNIVWYFHGK